MSSDVTNFSQRNHALWHNNGYADAAVELSIHDYLMETANTVMIVKMNTT
jgi:hypothetical protein